MRCIKCYSNIKVLEIIEFFVEELNFEILILYEKLKLKINRKAFTKPLYIHVIKKIAKITKKVIGPAIFAKLLVLKILF